MLEFFQGKIIEAGLSPWLTTALTIALNIIYCVIIVIVGMFISFALRKLLKWFFGRAQKKSGSSRETALTITNSIVKYAAYFMIFFQVLMVFGVSPESILAVAGIGSIALGFGAKGLVEDFIVGASVLVEKQYRVGDIVKIDDKAGTVEALTLRTTRIRAANGDMHIFPNSSIRVVTNMSKTFKRAIVDVFVSYGQSIDRVMELLRDEMELAGQTIAGLSEAPTVLGVISMDDNAITIRVTADCGVGENWDIERELRLLILRRFEREGVTPPASNIRVMT